MSLDPDWTRINLELPRTINDELKRFIPAGSKNAVFLSLIDKLRQHLLELGEVNGRYAITDILDGRFDITTPTTVQNLNEAE